MYIKTVRPLQEDSLSAVKWGHVDKEQLLDAVLSSKSPISLARKIYLKIDKDWKKHPRTAFHYPIAGIDGKINREGLTYARIYAEKEHEIGVLKKLRKLYKEYDLEW